jgi:hypothetical protein
MNASMLPRSLASLAACRSLSAWTEKLDRNAQFMESSIVSALTVAGAIAETISASVSHGAVRRKRMRLRCLSSLPYREGLGEAACITVTIY